MQHNAERGVRDEFSKESGSRKNRSSEVRPFGMRDKIGYLFGDFGNDFSFIFARDRKSVV